MALLVDDRFYEVTFKAPSDPAWAAITPSPPGFNSGPLSVAVFGSTPIVIYVSSASAGAFSHAGGQAYGFDDSVVASSTMLTDYRLISTNSIESRWAEDGTGVAYLLDPITQVVHEYDLSMVAAFKAFLP